MCVCVRAFLFTTWPHVTCPFLSHAHFLYQTIITHIYSGMLECYAALNFNLWDLQNSSRGCIMLHQRLIGSDVQWLASFRWCFCHSSREHFNFNRATNQLQWSITYSFFKTHCKVEIQVTYASANMPYMNFLRKQNGLLQPFKGIKTILYWIYFKTIQHLNQKPTMIHGMGLGIVCLSSCSVVLWENRWAFCRAPHVPHPAPWGPQPAKSMCGTNGTQKCSPMAVVVKWSGGLPCHYGRETWICLRWFFTLYHGKSPSNHHLGEYCWNFFKKNQTSKSKNKKGGELSQKPMPSCDSKFVDFEILDDQLGGLKLLEFHPLYLVTSCDFGGCERWKFLSSVKPRLRTHPRSRRSSIDLK